MQAAAVSLFLQLPDFTALWRPTVLFIREIITSAGDLHCLVTLVCLIRTPTSSLPLFLLPTHCQTTVNQHPVLGIATSSDDSSGGGQDLSP